MTVTANIIPGESISVSPDGWAATVVYHVTGLTGNANTRAYAAIISPGIPVIGTPHPAVSSMRVARVEAKPITSDTPNSMMVTVQYEQLQPDQQPPNEAQLPQVQVGSSVENTVTQKDVTGAQITVSHTYNETDENGDGVTRTETQGGEVEYQVPSTSVTFSRREGQSPAYKSRLFVGKTNAGSFGGDPAGSWLCTRIEGSSDDGGQTFNVTYEFQHNRDTWVATVVFIDPDTGRPPNGLVTGEGLIQVQVYQRIDFYQLNLGY